MKTKLSFLITLIALLLVPATALHAQESKKEQLQKRFKERYPAILELKSRGIVGETDEGFLDWVKKKDPKQAELVEQENADRKELYKDLAKKTNESEEKVAKHAAQRNFDKAKSGEFLKYAGEWKKKA